MLIKEMEVDHGGYFLGQEAVFLIKMVFIEGISGVPRPRAVI